MSTALKHVFRRWRPLAMPSQVGFSSTASRAAAQGKQHIVVALGGNALLKRGEEMTMENQRRNVAEGVSSLLPILKENTITFVHGNGPQVGLLALQGASYQKETGLSPMNLDVLDAETEGMIGYLIEQELCAQLGRNRGIVTILSEIVVGEDDPAFQNPTKFIGPIYTKEEAIKRLDGKHFKPDGDFFRQVVPSPFPVRLIDQQMQAVRHLTEKDCIVICAGGGGIPVVEDTNSGRLRGVEAVIDKDRAAAMLGVTLGADGLMILTDVAGVATNFGKPEAEWIKSASPKSLEAVNHHFPAGSMGPKCESVIDFVTTNGGWGMIGSLKEADKMMTRKAGTLVTNEFGEDHLEYY